MYWQSSYTLTHWGKSSTLCPRQLINGTQSTCEHDLQQMDMQRGFSTCAQFNTNAVMSENGGFYVYALISKCKNIRGKKKMVTEVYVSRCWLFFSLYLRNNKINGPCGHSWEESFRQGLGSPLLHTFNADIKNEAAQVKHRTSCMPGPRRLNTTVQGRSRRECTRGVKVRTPTLRKSGLPSYPPPSTPFLSDSLLINSLGCSTRFHFVIWCQ